VIGLWRDQPVFRRRRFFHGRDIRGDDSPDIRWLEPSGKEMSDDSWNNPAVRCLGMFLGGGRIDVDEHGEPITGDHVLMLFNSDHALQIDFTLPDMGNGVPWRLSFDTTRPEEPSADVDVAAYPLQPCSVAVFIAPLDDPSARANDLPRASQAAANGNPPRAK
jgi:glycogen operon protein